MVIDPELCEYEIPLIPPAGAFDARYLNPPGYTLLGEGILQDYRRYVWSTTIDTHVISFQPFIGPGYPMTLRWIRTEIQLLSDSAVLVDLLGFILRTRMDLQDSLIVTNDQVGQLQLYVYGQYADPTTVEQIFLRMPVGFALHQNYPNAFNPGTVITFQLPTSDFVRLKVYDILGREVATLFEGERVAGGHTVEWMPEGISGGIYTYWLTTSYITLARKMIFLK